MKRAILAAAFLVGLSTPVLAVEPTGVEINFNNYTHPTTGSTRTNLYFTFRSDSGVDPHNPATPIKIWARFENVPGVCGSANSTATVTMHNGTTMVMKKGLDYNMVVPQTWTVDWVLDFNTNIADTAFLSQCFLVGVYGSTGAMLPEL